MAAKIISFATRKGGSGKSTLVMLTATALHHRSDYKILIIDGDLQQSIFTKRQREKENPYDVVAFDWKHSKAEQRFKELIVKSQETYDVIFIDVPGKLEGNEIFYSILVADIIAVPVVARELDMASTATFLKTLPDVVEKKKSKGHKTAIIGIPNKVDRTTEQKSIGDIEKIGGLQLLENGLSDRVRYSRNVSTIKQLVKDDAKNDEFNDYFNEFLMVSEL